MKKILFIILMLWCAVSSAQTTGYFRYDTVKMAKTGTGTTELILQNATNARTGGVLKNAGNGRVTFEPVVDSIYKNATADSIVYKIMGVRRAFKDSIGIGSFAKDTFNFYAPLLVTAVTANQFDVRADTGRSVSQLVTGGTLKKVIDSLPTGGSGTLNTVLAAGNTATGKVAHFVNDNSYVDFFATDATTNISIGVDSRPYISGNNTTGSAFLIRMDSLTEFSTVFQLPQTASQFFATSVNGVGADVTGNVTIPGGGLSDTLSTTALTAGTKDVYIPKNLNVTGNVGIGTTADAGYRLTVKDSVLLVDGSDLPAIKMYQKSGANRISLFNGDGVELAFEAGDGYIFMPNTDLITANDADLGNPNFTIEPTAGSNDTAFSIRGYEGSVFGISKHGAVMNTSDVKLNRSGVYADGTIYASGTEVGLGDWNGYGNNTFISISDDAGNKSITYRADNSHSFIGHVVMSSRLEQNKGADVASANNLTLGDDGNLFHITGATQINAITTASWQAGSEITLLFDSNPTVKNNTAGGAGTAVLHLSGAADFSASANDILKLVFDGVAWFETSRSLN